jgi:tetratricopeptide (TPR) repeat protein
MYVDLSGRISTGHLLYLLLLALPATAQPSHTSAVPRAEYSSMATAIDETYGEQPHTALERMEREFARERPERGENYSGPAGTVSVEELRHPLSARAQKLIDQGQRYAKNGEHDKAIAGFQRALKETSAVPYAHSLLGIEYLKTNNVPAAIVELREAVRLLPATAVNHANLGYAYCMSGRAEMGEQELREAIKLDKSSPQPQYLLGLLLLDQKSPEAGHYLVRAKPRLRAAVLALAIFHWRGGDTGSAKQDLVDYLGTEASTQADTSEGWIASVASLSQPSVLFGFPQSIR